MGLGLLLVPALAGYWLITRLHYTHYLAARSSGYHVLFLAGLAGGVLFGIAYLITFILRYYFPEAGREWDSFAPAQYSDAVLLSALLGGIMPFAGNLLDGLMQAARQSESPPSLTKILRGNPRNASRRAAARRTAAESGDFIKLLIASSIDQNQAIEFSLRSGKSYIGLALESGIESVGDSDVSLVPIWSGYRDKATQELIITTEYASVIRESLAGNPPIAFQDFQVVIPMSEIVSARTFIPEAYERFRAAAGEPPHGAGGAETGAGKPE